MNNSIKINIIKGTNQIGGCITEIQSDKARIIIDFGEDLDNENKFSENVPKIDGLTVGIPKYDAVFITHSHQDHIGLIDRILPSIPVYVEEKSKKIYELTCGFNNKKCRENIKIIKFRKGRFDSADILINDMIIKYYKVDHSAYNSAMVLIKCHEKTILHTGDFRNHGYKGDKFIPTLNEIVSNNISYNKEETIDCLITEGTCFDRNNNITVTEQDLSDKASQIFSKYNQIFIMQSSTNIDRITSFFKASIKTRKKFIEDVFTANITLELGGNIPNPKFDDNKVSVWEPAIYKFCKSKEFREKYIEPLVKYKHVESVYGDYAMMVKSSMYPDIKMLYNKGKITNACLVYSMWHNYLKKPDVELFVNKVQALGIDFVELHTSGHANLDTVRLSAKILKPKNVIPIHTKNKEKAREIFENAVILDDNEQIEI